MKTLSSHLKYLQSQQWSTSKAVQIGESDFIKFTSGKNILSIHYGENKKWIGWYGKIDKAVEKYFHQTNNLTHEQVKFIFSSTKLSRRSLAFLAQETLQNNETARKLLQLMVGGL